MAGDYEVVEILGSGAQATVCVAREKAGGRLVALKVLKTANLSDPTALARARDEAQVLARLDHPNIVRVYELLDYEGRPVVEMELVRGIPLDAMLRIRPDGLPIRAVLGIVRDVARALAAAWQWPDTDGVTPMHIVHRDVKPSNLILTAEGVVKLVDFGIAKGSYASRHAKSFFPVEGTSGFVAPERKDGGSDTPAVDVYALGFVAFVLATGKTLLASRGSHDEGLSRQLAHLAPADLPPEAQEAFRELVAAMTSLEPGQRPTHAQVASGAAAIEAEAFGPDLVAFASETRPPPKSLVPVREQPDFVHLAFLETDSPSSTPTAVPLRPVDTERITRAFIAKEGWETRVPELQLVLSRTPEWRPGPFIELLDRAYVPAWKFWVVAARPSEIEAALLLLCDRPDPAVLSRARVLARHSDLRIAKAAQFLISTSKSS